MKYSTCKLVKIAKILDFPDLAPLDLIFTSMTFPFELRWQRHGSYITFFILFTLFLQVWLKYSTCRVVKIAKNWISPILPHWTLCLRQWSLIFEYDNKDICRTPFLSKIHRSSIFRWNILSANWSKTPKDQISPILPHWT